MVLTEDITPEDTAQIRSRLIAFNSEAVPIQGPNAQPLNLALRDSQGTLKGGLISSFHGWGILFIDLLWLDADCRGRGFGSQLLKKAEQLASQRGCRMIQVDTFDFQAPSFYQKQGYECFAILDDFPVGHCRYYFKKVIS